MDFMAAAQQAVVEMDTDKALEAANSGIAAGVPPMDLMTQGFIPGIIKVGDAFERGKVFLPELIRASEVMEAVTQVINQAIHAGDNQKEGLAVIATVKGDVHDIGKSIVVSLFKANGIEVCDMGRDIPVDAIVAKAKELQADVIGTSALLTTTMQEQKALEEALKKEGIREQFITVVGGAPVTERWAKRIGADVYAENVVDGVNKVLVKLRERK